MMSPRIDARPPTRRALRDRARASRRARRRAIAVALTLAVLFSDSVAGAVGGRTAAAEVAVTHGQDAPGAETETPVAADPGDATDDAPGAADDAGAAPVEHPGADVGPPDAADGDAEGTGPGAGVPTPGGAGAASDPEGDAAAPAGASSPEGRNTVCGYEGTDSTSQRLFRRREDPGTVQEGGGEATRARFTVEYSRPNARGQLYLERCDEISGWQVVQYQAHTTVPRDYHFYVPIDQDNAGWYRYRAVGGGSAVSETFEVKFQLLPPTVAAGQPGDRTVAPGTPVTMDADASGAARPRTHVVKRTMQSVDGGSTWAALPSPTFTVTEGHDGWLYKVAATRESTTGNPHVLPGTAESRIARLSTGGPPVITEQPQDTGVLVGDRATFGVSATGIEPRYQWERLIPGEPWTPLANQTNPSMTTSPTSAQMHLYQYRVVISTPLGTVTSDPAFLTVEEPARVGRHPVGTEVYASEEASFDATWVPASAARQYTARAYWQRSTDGGTTWADLGPGEGNCVSTVFGCRTELRLDYVEPWMDGDLLRVSLRHFDGAVQAAASTPARLTVLEPVPLVVRADPKDAEVLAGQVAKFTAEADGSPEPKAQWQVSSDGGGSWADVPGATSPTLELADATVAMSGQYKAVFTNTLGDRVDSEPATLTVEEPARVLRDPDHVEVYEGEEASFRVTWAPGAVGDSSRRQWQRSADDGATWVDVGKPTSCSGGVANGCVAPLSVVADLSMDGDLYRLSLSHFDGRVEAGVSEAARLTVLKRAAPQVTTHPEDAEVLAGQDAVFTAEATGSPAPTVQWHVSSDGGGPWEPVAGATSPTLVVGGATVEMSGDRYKAVFTNRFGEVVESRAATLTVRAVRPLHLVVTPRAVVVDRLPG